MYNPSTNQILWGVLRCRFGCILLLYNPNLGNQILWGFRLAFLLEILFYRKEKLLTTKIARPIIEIENIILFNVAFGNPIFIYTV